MVHLFFHQLFWVSNWNIFDESKIYSYTLKGGEFNGKVCFSQKQNPYNIFGTTSSFLWVSHQKKWKDFFFAEINLTIKFITLQIVGKKIHLIQYVPI